MLSRRRLLTAALLAPALSWASGTPVPQRLAVLDWGLAGDDPRPRRDAGRRFGAGVVSQADPHPALPKTVQDLGLLFQPNLKRSTR